MFVDKVSVIISAGKGGDGAVSFRHEKFVDRGGPDGGDGGDGADVVAVASRNQNTLAAFRYKREITAEDGDNGQKRKKHGKSAKNLILSLPVGTVITSENGKVIADLIEDGQEVVIAEGGKGGFGNAHFVSSRRQAPRIAEKGEPGDSFEAIMELKMIAEVGLVGLPNAGKSSLLAKVSNARPEIANYPFTTLRPNLGVAEVDDKNSILLADIPGLIEGASKGKGLGDDFLRHIERTKILVHLIDVYQEDVKKAYTTIQEELANYRVNLTKNPQVVVLNKIDGVDKEIVDDQLKLLKPLLPRGTKTLAISAKSGEGLKDLMYLLKEMIAKHKVKKEKIDKVDELPVLKLADDEPSWTVEKTKKAYFVQGKKIERFAVRTDFSNDAGVQRLRDIMKKMGITHELERQGIKSGDKVLIGKNQYGEIEY